MDKNFFEFVRTRGNNNSLKTQLTVTIDAMTYPEKSDALISSSRSSKFMRVPPAFPVLEAKPERPDHMVSQPPLLMSASNFLAIMAGIPCCNHTFL